MPRWRSAVAAVDWRFVAAWLATLTMIWVTYAFAHRAVVENMERDLRQRLETDTLVLEDHASRALDGVVSNLEAVAALSDSQELANKEKFSRRLRDLLFDDTVVRSLSLVDAQGFVVVSSNLSNVGQRVTQTVLASLGPLPLQPRKGVRFTSSEGQRDVTDPLTVSPAGDAAQMLWLAHIDAGTSDLVAHRWIATINSGFFQNFWSAATPGNDFQLGLFDYNGQRLVSLGRGPADTGLWARGLQAALQVRESGEVAVDGLEDWLVRYRASARHPLVFAMFVDRTLRLEEQFDRTSALRFSALGGSLLASMVIGLFYLGSRRHHRYAWANKQLRQQAHTDALTGLANRRAFDEFVPQELTRAGALGLPLSLLVMDLDHFKIINDRFGHAEGDAVLKEMAKRWQTLLRSSDLIARIGGEEFCVMLPGTGIRQAETVALKLLEETRRKDVAVPGLAPLVPVTVSIGLIGFDACPADADVDTLLKVADSALYRAKVSGRNQAVAVSLYGEHEDRMKFHLLGDKEETIVQIDGSAWLRPDTRPSVAAPANDQQLAEGTEKDK